MNEPIQQYVMTSEELTDALMYANACFKNCAPDAQPLWRSHLKALMEIQARRAATFQLVTPAD